MIDYSIRGRGIGENFFDTLGHIFQTGAGIYERARPGNRGIVPPNGPSAPAPTPPPAFGGTSVLIVGGVIVGAILLLR